MLGLDWVYDAVDVTEEGLAEFLDGLDDTWRGLSLTMPLKRTVIPLLDEYDEWVTASGVANTVVLREGRRLGNNTDIPGAITALADLAETADAVVLGGGATAVSVLIALARRGCRRARLLVRSPQRAADTVSALATAVPELTVDVGSITDGALDADILVSTIPASAQTPELLRRLDAPAVFDVVYDPWPTPLMSAAQDSGARVVTGLDLLVHQAAAQVSLMTGALDVPVEAMREAGLAELTARSERSK